jgi:signal transduction histidine kinase
MRRVRIRAKLLAALAVPLICLLVVVVFQVVDIDRHADQAAAEADIALAAIGPSGLMTALQDERSWAVVELVGQGENVNLAVVGYDDTRAITDDSIADFRAEVEQKGGDVAAAYRVALDTLVDLEALREDIDVYDGEKSLVASDFADTIFRRYASIITPFQEGNTALALAVDDPDLRQGVELIDLIGREVETSAEMIRATIQAVLPPETEVNRTEIVQLSELSDRYLRYAHALEDLGTGEYRRATDQHLFIDWMEEVAGHAQGAAIDGTANPGDVLATTNVPDERQLKALSLALADQLAVVAKDFEHDAAQRVQIFRILALVVVLAAAVAVYLVSRAITKPLAALTAQATDMANRRLPTAVLDVLQTPLGDDVAVPHVQPVHIGTRDEVGDVAHAINTVQDSALNLAVEQAMLRRNIADSFVNLGRRNQHLLGRQLDFITELEVNETDPDVLANLFRLDHLATRMRRNAESLLLLAGVEPPRKWAAPVRITDAIRAALGEVEDYPRVIDRGVEPATLVGAVAADIAHLLAELIDNALIYSPPDKAVEVRGRLRPDGYTLAIVDAGLGMRPAELEQANRRLAGRESFTIAPSKYLGHYVAGNLAARHDIVVSLHNSPGNGVTATVALPQHLLSGEGNPNPNPNRPAFA